MSSKVLAQNEKLVLAIISKDPFTFRALSELKPPAEAQVAKTDFIPYDPTQGESEDGLDPEEPTSMTDWASDFNDDDIAFMGHNRG